MFLRKGQSLLETIFALSILLTVLFGIMTFVLNNFSVERAGWLQTQALALASEALEGVLNIRDSNWLQDKDPWDGILGETENSRRAILVFDPNSNFSPSLIEADETNTKIYEKNGFYLQGAEVRNEGSPTVFKRYLVLQEIKEEQAKESSQAAPAPSLQTQQAKTGKRIGVKAEAHVSWFERGREREVVLKSEFYDWR